jgi:hypothetical protein
VLNLRKIVISVITNDDIDYSRSVLGKSFDARTLGRGLIGRSQSVWTARLVIIGVTAVLGCSLLGDHGVALGVERRGLGDLAGESSNRFDLFNATGAV